MSSSATLNRKRLSPTQVAQYNAEGYLIFKEPVLPVAKFEGLKGYFEQILEDLPSDVRPEAMDVPHFVHPKLLEWAFDALILNIVEPITGTNIALYSSHFICKPKGNGQTRSLA